MRAHIDALWDQAPPHIQQTAIEHRWMHAETLAYLLHNLPVEQKRRPASSLAGYREGPHVSHRFIDIPEGVATLGRTRDSGFGWDNEFHEIHEDVPAFSIYRHKVTNRDYLEFVHEGNPAPHFWFHRENAWFYRGMFEWVPLPLDAPVYVTQEQAAAYAYSRGAMLPTEAQFHRAAFGTPEGGERPDTLGRYRPTGRRVRQLRFPTLGPGCRHAIIRKASALSA